MTDIKIDKNIPQPDRNAGKPPIYPFGEMDIDDSIFIGRNDKKKAVSAAHVYAHRNGVKLKCRKQPCGGVRIWRVE